MAETRKLAAIPAADIAGCSKLAGADEARTPARLRAFRSESCSQAPIYESVSDLTRRR